ENIAYGPTLERKSCDHRAVSRRQIHDGSGAGASWRAGRIDPSEPAGGVAVRQIRSGCFCVVGLRVADHRTVENVGELHANIEIHSFGNTEGSAQVHAFHGP